VSDAPVEAGLDASPVATQRRVKDILRSTLIVGGGSLVTVLCSVARGKIISVIVGPAGIGLQGLLQSTMKTTSAIAGVGVNASGVREVARLRGEDDRVELSHLLRAVRLITLVLGALAALFLFAFQRPLGRELLDDSALGWTLGVIGLGVFASVAQASYDVFLRGFRRVALVTKAAIFANVLATGLAIALVSLLGDDGISWALVSQPICLLLTSAIAGRDYGKHFVAPDRARIRAAIGRLVPMGVVLAATGFASTAAQLAARVIVAHWASLDEVGYFQGASAVSVLYLGFVLSAMSLDYFPRLAEAAGNAKAASQMINEQARVSFLLAGPAVLGLLTLSSQVIMLLYSSKFAPSVEILRWQLVGDVLKIGSWTLSYLVLAQGRPRAFFVTEMSWNVTYLIALTVMLPAFGILATAFAYVIACGVYFVVLCFASNRLVGFSWSSGNVLMMVAIAVLSVVIMAGHLLLPSPWNLVVGIATTVMFGLYCLRRLIHEAGFARIIRKRG